MSNINKWDISNRSRAFRYKICVVSKIAYTLAAFTVCACAFTRVDAQVEKPETVLKNSVTINQLPRYIANFKMSVGGGTATGVKYGEKVGDSTYTRTETTTTAAGLKMQSIVIGTPGTSYMVFPSSKQIIKTKDSSMDSQLSLDRLLTNPANYSLKMTTENLAGHNCYKLDISFRGPELDKVNAGMRALAPTVPTLAREEQWVDVSDHFVRKTAVYDQSGKLISATEYSNVQVGVKVDPALFKLPAGYNVVETSGFADTMKATVKNQVMSLEKPRQERQLNASLPIRIFSGILVALVVIGFLFRMRKLRTTAR